MQRCRDAEMLVTDTWLGRDLLKARLPASPCHPRALLTLCEGLALWHGIRLCIAVSADADAQRGFERIFYGDGLIDPRSPLVTLEVRPPRAVPWRAREGLCRDTRARPGPLTAASTMSTSVRCAATTTVCSTAA